MKNNTQPALKERIEKALEDFTKGRASMHVPPLDTDVDMVLAECSDRLSELEASSAHLAAENAGLKECNTDIMKHVYRSKTYLASSRVVDAIQGLQCAIERKSGKTPATDAFLAEVRASAVDEVCLKISNAIVNCHQDEQIGLDEAATICGDYASELRKGVQS